MNQDGARRKRLLINPGFQIRFGFYAMGMTLMTLPIFIAVNTFFFSLFAKKMDRMGLPPEHELIQFAHRQEALIWVLLGGATVTALITSLVMSYIMSNRIAGSMYRLTTSLNQAADVQSAQAVKPRKGDFFVEVFEAYNRLIERSRS